MQPTDDPTTPAIEVSGLCKAYTAGTPVLDGVDLRVEPGTVHALLGPNGSGKTTTVNILSTLVRPDAGRARVLGRDVVREPDAVRRLVGVTGQFSAVDALLTGRENLDLMADLHHLPRQASRRRIDDLLDLFDLTQAAGRIPATYSGGMRRRLDLAMTLVAAPQVIFLDEPTTGLDPRGRRDLWDVVRDLTGTGVTILLTTQYLEEADQLADRIAVLDTGRVIADGSPAELKRRVPGAHLRLRVTRPEAVRDVVAGLPGAEADPADTSGTAVRLPWHGDWREMTATVDALDGLGVEVADLGVHSPDLDDVFFALTGRPARQAAEPDPNDAPTPEGVPA